MAGASRSAEQGSVGCGHSSVLRWLSAPGATALASSSQHVLYARAHPVAPRYDDIVKGLTPFLKTAGYNPKKDLTFIPISALSGHNVKVGSDCRARARAPVVAPACVGPPRGWPVSRAAAWPVFNLHRPSTPGPDRRAPASRRAPGTTAPPCLRPLTRWRWRRGAAAACLGPRATACAPCTKATSLMLEPGRQRLRQNRQRLSPLPRHPGVL